MFARGSSHFLTTSRRTAGIRRQRISYDARQLREQAPRNELIVWTLFPGLTAQMRPIPVKVRRDR